MSRIINFCLLILFTCSCIQIKQTVVDEEKFLGNKKNNTTIYAKQGSTKILNPFNINTDNWGLGTINRLMLVEFEELEKYNSIELQVIENNDTIGGLVILYYAEGRKADVYHSPNLQLDEETYNNILNNAKVLPANIHYTFFEKDGFLKASLDFIDRFGNRIQMNVDEKIGEMKPCGLLAPIGGEAETPEFMTIIYMKHFRFLSQKEESIEVRINNTKAELIKLPIKINGVKGYQAKYSMEPVTISWNRNANAESDMLQVTNGTYKSDEFMLEFLKNDSFYEIASFTGIQNKHQVTFRFSPAIPDLKCLKNQVELTGRFSMSVDSTKGIIAGEYSIESHNKTVRITIQPTKGYSPVPGKAWMKKLSWEALILNDNEKYMMISEWRKK